MTDVEPGDLVLVKSHGRFFALARRLGGNPYDHVSVVLSRGDTINVDKPMARRLPLARLLRDSLAPLVLRPAWSSPAERDAFVAWMESLEGSRYDTRRTLRLVLRILLEHRLGIVWPMEAPRHGQPAWICTDAVLLGLSEHAARFHAMHRMPLDWNDLRCGTTNDFLRLLEEGTGFFRVVS